MITKEEFISMPEGQVFWVVSCNSQMGPSNICKESFQGLDSDYIMTYSGGYKFGSSLRMGLACFLTEEAALEYANKTAADYTLRLKKNIISQIGNLEQDLENLEENPFTSKDFVYLDRTQTEKG